MGWCERSNEPLEFHERQAISSTTWVTVSFSKRTLIDGVGCLLFIPVTILGKCFYFNLITVLKIYIYVHNNFMCWFTFALCLCLQYPLLKFGVLVVIYLGFISPVTELTIFYFHFSIKVQHLLAFVGWVFKCNGFSGVVKLMSLHLGLWFQITELHLIPCDMWQESLTFSSVLVQEIEGYCSLSVFVCIHGNQWVQTLTKSGTSTSHCLSLHLPCNNHCE